MATVQRSGWSLLEALKGQGLPAGPASVLTAGQAVSPFPAPTPV